MSKEKELVRNQEQFLVRLPDGMRERIKAKAQRAGMSMNEAIVYCLEQYFPAPKSIEAKIEELAEMVAILKGDDTYKAIGDLTAHIHDALIDIGGKDVIGPVDFKDLVNQRFEQWKEWEFEREQDENHNPFDDAYYPDPNRERTYADWNPESPDYDPFTTDSLPKKE